MKALTLLLLLTTTLTQPTQSRPARRRLGRALQNSSAVCTFDAFMADECSYEEFCLPTELNSAVYCEGLPNSTWTVEVIYYALCYDDFDDLEGELYNASIPIPPDGYCATERELFTFAQNVLTNVTLVQSITAPYQNDVFEQYNIKACPDSELPDFVFGENYCYDGCPVVASIGGDFCTGECTLCADGAGLLNCSNVDPTLVSTCSDEDDTIYEKLVNYLGQAEESPNAAPATSPAAAPVTSTDVTPTQTAAQQPAAETPVVEPSAPSPTTAQQPTSDEEPTVNPFNTTESTSSSTEMRNVMAVGMLTLIAHALWFA